MTNLFLKKVASVVIAFATLITLAPLQTFAAYLAAPTDVEVVSGTYTSDTTPTFSWDRSTNATWYEVAVDTESAESLGNVDSYTSSTLSAGWHTFYVWAHDNNGNESATASVTFEIDTQGPTVPAVSPSSATEDEAVTFSVYPYGEAAPTSCVLYVDGSSAGTMSKSGSMFYKSYTFSWDGTYTVYARCTDGDGNVTSGTSRTVTVNNENGSDDSFIVPAVSPSSATEDEAVTFSVYPYGDLDADTCKLYVDGASVGTMSESSGTFSKSYTFSNDGTYKVYAYCEDENGDWTWGTSRNVSVANEGDDNEEYPTVPAVSPSKAVEDEEVEISVEPYSDEDVEWCDLYVSGSNVGDMYRESDDTFTLDYTFKNNGSYTVYAKCTDASYDTTTGTSRTVTVSSSDDEEFTVPAVSPSKAVEDEEVTFSVTPEGDLDADSCKLYVSGSNVGTMDEDDGEFTRDYTFSNNGSYTVYAYCEDENGDWTKGTSRTVVVSNEGSSSSDSLEVPRVTPSSADEDEKTEFEVRPTSDHNVTDCWLYVDDKRVETMDEESNNVFVADYTFTKKGTYDVHAVCKDSSGDTVTGSERSVSVGSSSSSNDDEADRGSLIKTECGASSTVSDPCRAVYYYGEDGDRHAFPNESTFYSWFADFDDVVEVSDDFMASIDMGDNVTYRPGSVLVKFDSSSKVYAIEDQNTLRHYTSTSALESDYGSDWEEVLVSLPDTLYKNYEIGDDIDSKNDFDRTDAYYSVESIEDVL